MKSSTRSLTEGPLAKQILLVSLPLALSNLLQVLFNMSIGQTHLSLEAYIFLIDIVHHHAIGMA